MDDDTEETSRRLKYSVIFSIGMLLAIIIIGIWLTFVVEAETVVTMEQPDGPITIVGPEEQFVGSVTGEAHGRKITISGLVDTGPVQDEPVAWRALCAMRESEDNDWSNAAASLRSHLASERMDAFCAPFQ